MHILIIEDEPLAAEKLHELIDRHLPEGKVVGTIRSIQDGKAWLDQHPIPDLIFSDIELLDGRVFELYAQHPVACPIIFTTAYDQFLLDAFQTNGIAYLLKPFTPGTFREAVEKYRRLFRQEEASTQLTPALVTQLQAALRPASVTYKQRFTIKRPQGIYLLATDQIRYFSADGNLVMAHDDKGKRHPVNHKLSELESLLDPALFFRVNRSEIIHIAALTKLEPYFNDRLAVTLTGRSDVVIVSASRVPALRKWIEG